MRKYLLFIAALFIATPLVSIELKDMVAYTTKIDENLKPDHKDYMFPQYNLSLGLKRSGFLDQFINTIIPKQLKTFWSKKDFEHHIKLVLEQRAKEKLHGEYIKKLTIKDGDSIVVFGNLQGAYHSLIRTLEYLKKQNIINENLEVTKQNTNIVFLGDVVNRSPYLLQTLTVVLILMHRNPDKVIYVKGKDEDVKYISNELLGSELARFYRGKNLEKMIEKIARFFNTLPAAAIGEFEKTKESVLLTSSGITSSIEKEIARQTPPVSIHSIKAILEGVSEKMEYRRSSGLILSEPVHGITTWSLCSSPTPVFTDLYDFYYDAFCMISIKSSLNTSLISLYNQNTQLKKGISKEKTQCLTSGSKVTKETPECPTKAPIIVGCTLDLTKGISAQGKFLKKGINFKINEVNTKGGINGHPIKAVFLDDEYTPHLAAENINSLVKDYKTNIILAPIGSPTLGRYYNQVVTQDITVLFPVTGVSEFRKPAVPNIIHLRPSYEREGSVLMNYALKQIPRLKYLAFYQNDTFGRSLLDGAEKEFKQHKNGHIFKKISYERNQVDFKHLIDNIKSYDPDVIFLFSTSAAAIELIRQLGVDYFANRKLLGDSDMSETNFKTFMKSKGIPYSFLQIFPQQSELTSDTMKNYFLQIGKQNLPYDVFSLEGYVAASLLVYALEKIDAPYTGEKITKELEGIDTKSITGFKLSLNPQSRELSNNLWMVTDYGTDDQVTTLLNK